MKKILINIIQLFSKIIIKDKRLLTLFYNGYSGSNLSPIIDYYINNPPEDYKIKVIRIDKLLSEAEDVFMKIKNRFKIFKYTLKSGTIISTHGLHRLRNDNIMINLWHGIPIKSMSLMNKAKTDDLNQVKDDYFISTSVFSNTIINSCLGITAEKYHIAGYPRNDYLFSENGVENLNNLLNIKAEGKIIMFMPTYRQRNDKKDSVNNLFGFLDFNMKEFDEFLEKNNITLLLKLHPNEENLVIDKYIDFINDRIILIKSSDLEIKEMDLYKIINSIDLLITDYSSIYFDYLLLDRPIIFTPTDLNEYRSNRGLLLEPYDFWTPGYKCLNQEVLQEMIYLCLKDSTQYKEERKVIRDIVHKYQDGNSTDRVMDLIESVMRKK